MEREKTLVIGIGNPILGDDGVGWLVAQEVEKKLADMGFCHIEVDCLALGGLSLMERMVGYDRAILVDAIVTGKQDLGHVFLFPLEALPNRALGHLCSSHDTTLQNAIQLGLSMGAPLPTSITVIAIESRIVFDFSEELSPPVAAAVPQAVEKVLDLVIEASIPEDPD